MGFKDFMSGIKQKCEDFLYTKEGVEQEEENSPDPLYEAAQQQVPQQYAQQPYAQQYAQPQPQQYRQPYAQPQQQYAQQPYAQQPAYQQPQNVYQPVTQPQPQQPQMFTQFSSQLQQPQSQPRNRRMQQHQQEQEQPQQNVVQFPGAYQQQENKPEEDKTPVNLRVISIRGINDCRSAIALLRGGDALVVVMDGVPDQAEKRRYVDIFSGACFSLGATITKVSQYGAYLVAPSRVRVFADQVTSQMNSGAQAASQHVPQNTPVMPQQPAYQQPTDQQGFTQRAPAQDVQSGAFYPRQPMPAPQSPSFSAQAGNAGYVPDQAEMAE